MRYFRLSLTVTVLGILAGAGLGYYYTSTLAGALNSAFIVLVLGILEVSLSFDNAVVNATVLEDMNAVWRRRFLTWGILIAVFGMRLVFPLVIVAIAAKLGPIQAIVLAATDPEQYQKILEAAGPSVAAFGGSFLMLVGLNYFFDPEKKTHWFKWPEKHLARLGCVNSLPIAIVIAGLAIFSTHTQHTLTILTSGILGVVTFVLVEGIGSFMEGTEETIEKKIKPGIALFLYLETLDASFSFDGVIGAFALSNNLFIIALGLGIGAMFVRSLTVMLVEKRALREYAYLEHGAFYAILALSVLMFLKEVTEVPEIITGLTGAGLIAISFLWSIPSKKSGKIYHALRVKSEGR